MQWKESEVECIRRGDIRLQKVGALNILLRKTETLIDSADV